ncbi:hypothetical protein ACIPQJ_09480 [Streptomyces sp. NPDC090082]|uniref:hypothetical protein n=1 Tax=unclassified Streptomyces TaxID=2593676 RepID=UPI0037F83E42
MDTTERTEARIEDAGNTLVAPSTPGGDDPVRDFFGSTTTPEDLASATHGLTGGTVCLTGEPSPPSPARHIGPASI